MLIQWRRNLCVTMLAAAALSACARSRGPITYDPDVKIAAHLARGGLFVDRVPSGRAVRLEAGGWLSNPGRPSYRLLGDNPDQVTGLWVVGHSRMMVRESASTLEPIAGEVVASWEEAAIRLTLHLANAHVLHTDAFAREGGGTGPSTLNRSAQTVLDVRGTYRAAVRNGDGAAVGWLRAKIGPYQKAPRIYDGVLPDEVSDGVAVAATIVLDGEIGWIEDHATDVYRGTGDGRLEKSVPF